MPIWIHRYELRPRQSLNAHAGAAPRKGALLRFGDGVADLHPWPELGDAPLDEQLLRLARGESTPLTRASLRLAAIDGEARLAGRSLFQGLQIPPSHFLLATIEADFDPDAIAGSGFARIKVKMGRDLVSEQRWLEQVAPRLGTLRLRIDFNDSLDTERCGAFLQALSPSVLAAIDFLEDPFSYDAGSWSMLSSRHRCRFARDRGDEEAIAGIAVRVIKPAAQEPELLLRRAMAAQQEIVITSSMDHPIGQLGAAYVAAMARRDPGVRIGDCGLLTHQLYEPDPFLERLRTDGPFLLAPHGTGLGFDDLLEQLTWQALS